MKLIGCIMGQDAENTIELAINSLEGCDEIIYLDGGSTDKTIKIVGMKVVLITNKWDKTQDGMASIQKNFMLNYLKENYMGDWVIHIDADEMLDDGMVDKIRNVIENTSSDTEIYDVRMRHLIYNLTLEDSIKSIHRTPTRLFKVTKKIFYPVGNHITLHGGKYDNVGFCPDIVLWHFAYCEGIWGIKKRYDGQKMRGGPGTHNIKTLKELKNSHLFGSYPISKIESIDLPRALLETFDIDKDEIYFANRGIELKHSIMVKQWNDYFKPESVLDLGCGRGPYMFFWRWYVKDVSGIELSQWAVDNAFCEGIKKGDISEPYLYNDKEDLIMVIDVLEHLDNKQLNDTLMHMSFFGKKFIFSIPFIGNPNLETDKTHIQKKTKEDWIKLIQSYGIIINPTPEGWMFKEQILVGTKE